jgi:hypothetical protein
MSDFQLGLVFTMLFRMVMAEASYQRAKRTKESVRFPPSVPIRLLFRLGIPFFLYALFKAQGESNTTFNYTVYAISTVAAVAAFFFLEPPEIRIDRSGITQSGLFGLRKRSLAWDGLAASYTPQLQEVILIGNDGATITHTQYHVGQSELVHELRSRKVFFHGDKII